MKGFVCLLCVCMALWGGCGSKLPTQRSFDAAVWQDAVPDGDGYSPRASMVRDLVRQYLALGMTRASVEAMLGPPDAEEWTSALPYPGWSIGVLDDGVDSDTYGLIVRFDSYERVAEVICP